MCTVVQHFLTKSDLLIILSVYNDSSTEKSRQHILYVGVIIVMSVEGEFTFVYFTCVNARYVQRKFHHSATQDSICLRSHVGIYRM